MKAQLKGILILGLTIVAGFSSCTNKNKKEISGGGDSLLAYVSERLPIYVKVKLSTDLQKLTENERKVLPLLIRATEVMDELWPLGSAE